MSAPGLTAEALEVLETLECDGNAVRITAGDLPRQLYEEVDEVLKRLGGKWKGGRTRAHLFPYDPRPLVEDVLQSGEMPPKNPNAYFPTPAELADELVRLVDLYPSDRFRVLEPSAGQGAIVDAIRRVDPKIAIDACELSPHNRAVLEKKGVRIVGDDFLAFEPEEKYRWILMNPPFSVESDKKAYIAHVMHAFRMLDEQGVLAAIVPIGFLRNENRKEREFLEFVREHGSAYQNGAGAFKESGTMIDTMTLVLERSPRNKKPCMGYPSGYAYEFILSIDEEMDRILCSAVEESATRTRMRLSNSIPVTMRPYWAPSPGQTVSRKFEWATEPFKWADAVCVDDIVPAVLEAFQIADEDEDRGITRLHLPRKEKWLRQYAASVIAYYDYLPVFEPVVDTGHTSPKRTIEEETNMVLSAGEADEVEPDATNQETALQGLLFDPETLEVACL